MSVLQYTMIFVLGICSFIGFLLHGQFVEMQDKQKATK